MRIKLHTFLYVTEMQLGFYPCFFYIKYNFHIRPTHGFISESDLLPKIVVINFV